ncbi:MAG: ammonia-forming cytochrome c nitrite reductase subunit c552 [Planctomycetota bacterium]|jgi:tetratricopeptide (TPR) repeat protein
MINQLLKLTGVCVLALVLVSCKEKAPQSNDSVFSGSESCRECHERFYELWAPSYHGKAMEPVNAAYVAENQLPDSRPIALEGKTYQVVTRDAAMVLYEKEGDKLLNSYKMVWAMGGHNVSCFLTPLDKGKLQTIPLAYDHNGKTWFNYPASAIRDFGDDYPDDEVLPWKDPMFTFNTGCYSCHISQLSTNYDLATDTYRTTWREAGINCETCHGPGAEHIRIFKDLKEGEEPEDVGLIVTGDFTPEQHNSSCAPCHAKMNPITPSYLPGEKYFDNYNITTLEDRDFYPDGRSLGENYTMTDWMLNPCGRNSGLHCITCHTSSGRDRNKDQPNEGCLSCHSDRRDEIEAHTGHPPEAGLTCISCHMPKRQFVGRFMRSDHSFRPPMPEATIRFGSPNACNQCHADKSPQWANDIVKARPNGDYQQETLAWAQLIKDARAGNWTHIDKMYHYIKTEKAGEVVTTSLIRLLGSCVLESKVPVLLEALRSESALVRSAAAIGLSGYTTAPVKAALLKACEDEIRLVRINAANALVAFPPDQLVYQLSAQEKTAFANAEAEYVTSMTSRPDNWSDHYNLGNYYQEKGQATAALDSYETAARLYPESIMPLINSSVLYASVGNLAKAEENLKKVIAFDPDNEAANVNLGLLLAEQGRAAEAENALKTALKAGPKPNPLAAKNLSVLVAQRGDLDGAVTYARMAYKGRPEAPDYGYILAYYQLQNGQTPDAKETLQQVIQSHPGYITAIRLLADIYLREGSKEKALQVYQAALKAKGLSYQDSMAIQQWMIDLQP